jgi:cytochrome c556
MSMKHHPATALAIAMGLVLPCASAQAQFARLNDAVKYRQAAFQVMSTHVQRIGAMAKGDAPFDKPAAEAQAAIIELLSRQLSSAFPPGSDMAPSKAKPEVWQDAAQFKTHGDQLQSASSKLSGAARSGDLIALKAAFNTLSQTCKACHDGYRNR